MYNFKIRSSMKKLLLSCLLSALCLTTAFAVDYSGTCGANLTWDYNQTTNTLTIQGSGQMDDYTTSSLAPWVYNINGDMTIIINEGVTSIGEYAFLGTANIRILNISLPSTLVSIGKDAFLSNQSLTSIVIPDNVTKIGAMAFMGCVNLSSVKIGNSVTNIGDHAFCNCPQLTSITIPNSVTTIGSSAFSQCTSLSDLTLGTSILSIPEGCFQDCNKLSSVVIPNSVSTIGSSSFSGNSLLSYVKIGSGIISIGLSAFYECRNLKKITIDATVPPSLNYSFWQTGLDTVYVPCSSVGAYEASSWGGYTIIGIDCTEPPTENSTFWNISDAAFNSLGTITSTKTINGLTIKATSDKAVTIDADAREIDGLSFTHRLKFGGTGTSDARLLSFHVNGNCDIDVYLMSASGTADRTLNVDKGSFGNNLQQLAAPAGTITKGTVHYTGSATTIYLYSPSSGVNIYAIRVTEVSSSSTTSYTVSVSSANSSMGTVSGGGQYDEGSTATVIATPKSGYKFTKWSNGSTANPYSFTVTQNVSLTAYFEQSTTPQSESKFWNISDAVFNSLGTITSQTTINGLTIHATANKPIVVDADAREINGYSFTHRLKFGGTGVNDARMLSFRVDGDCDIDIYLMSASGSADRTLNVDKGSFGNTIQQIPAYGSTISEGNVHYAGGATTIYLYSPSSGVNIYAIRVTYGGKEEGIDDIYVQPQEEASKILQNGQIFILRGEKVYSIT